MSNRKSAERAVEHLADGREAWKLGLVGALTKYKGRVFTGISAIFLGGIPWWLPDNTIPDLIIFDLKLTILCCFIFLAFLAIGAFYYLEFRSKRSLNNKVYLHEISHFLRDHHVEISRILSEKKYSHVDGEFLKTFLENLCDKLRKYLSNELYDDTVEVAIRLAMEQDHSIKYVTLGRSSGFTKGRELTSEGIPYNEGIPNFFRIKHFMGILRYNDIPAAIKYGLFKNTINEEKYDDVNTFMVAPINSWDGISNNMIGLLYVTSRKINTFKMKHTDTIKFFADMIAPFISYTVSVVKANDKNLGE